MDNEIRNDIPDTVGAQAPASAVQAEEASGEVPAQPEKAAKKSASGDNPEKGFAATLYEAASVLVSAFVMLAIVFSFLFRVVGVKGYSMENTVFQGDWLLTFQKAQYEQGDIVVITQDNFFHEPLIKRVVATSGQTVDINYNTSTVYVDGIALDEPYTKEDVIEYDYGDREFPYVVPDGHLFVMGDNRNNSTDSRSSLVGPIDERYILGRASVRIIPFGDFNIYDYE